MSLSPHPTHLFFGVYVMALAYTSVTVLAKKSSTGIKLLFCQKKKQNKKHFELYLAMYRNQMQLQVQL